MYTRSGITAALHRVFGRGVPYDDAHPPRFSRQTPVTNHTYWNGTVDATSYTPSEWGTLFDTWLQRYLSILIRPDHRLRGTDHAKVRACYQAMPPSIQLMMRLLLDDMGRMGLVPYQGQYPVRSPGRRYFTTLDVLCYQESRNRWVVLELKSGYTGDITRPVSHTPQWLAPCVTCRPRDPEADEEPVGESTDSADGADPHGHGHALVRPSGVTLEDMYEPLEDRSARALLKTDWFTLYGWHDLNKHIIQTLAGWTLFQSTYQRSSTTVGRTTHMGPAPHRTSAYLVYLNRQSPPVGSAKDLVIKDGVYIHEPLQLQWLYVTRSHLKSCVYQWLMTDLEEAPPLVVPSEPFQGGHRMNGTRLSRSRGEGRGTWL